MQLVRGSRLLNAAVLVAVYLVALFFLIWVTQLDDAVWNWVEDAGGVGAALTRGWESTFGVSEGDGDGLDNAASDFAMATTLGFFLVVLVASLAGIWMGTSQKVLLASFSHRVRGNRGKLVSAMTSELPDEPQTDSSVCAPVRDNIAALRQSSRLGRTNVITRRLASVEAMLVQRSTLEGVSRHVLDLPGEPDGDRPWVAALNMVLMITLFAGIIGTFVGLMYFVVSNALQEILQSDGSLDADQVQEVLKAFQPAFGSSLVAYTSYIFVRYARDRADEAFQAAVGDLDAELQRPLKAHFRRYEIAARFQVTLDRETAKSLDNVVQQIADVRSTLKTAADTLSEQTKAIAKAAEALEDATTRMGSQVSNISTELNKAADRWKSTTEDFDTAANHFKSAAGNLLTQVKTTIGELGENLASASQEAGKGAEDLHKNVEAATQSLSGTMQDMERVFTRFENAMEAERGRDEVLQTTVDKVRELAQQLRDEVDQLPSMLEPYVARLDEVAKNRGDHVAKRVDELANKLVETNDGIRACAGQLTGGEKGADLKSVLERIDQKLTDGAVPGLTAGDGADDRRSSSQ